MTLLYYDPIFLAHETGKHPERPERLRAVMRHLERTGLAARCGRPAWDPVRQDRLTRIHRPAYLESLKAFVSAGGGRIEVDTVVCSASYDVALKAAGAVCDAVERVTGGEDRQAICLVRPPGHHARADGAMGFCLLNNIAVGARTAVEEFGLDRVLIVDWDVHHGNGTQEAFWTDTRVGFLSIHRFPFYPGTGAEDERGAGAGLGTTVNLPIQFGLSRSAYYDRFAAEVRRFADRIRPQLVMISAGFDSHRDDPVGSLGLETEDFGPLTDVVLEVAKTHAEGRLISVLEGGYNTGVLAGCVEVHLRRLLATEEEPPH